MNPPIKKLYDHQLKVLQGNRSKLLIAHGTGTGKTITSLELAHKNSIAALIICPKGLKANWGRAIVDYPEGHKIISKEEFRRDWQKLPAFKAIISDEAHYFAGMTSQMSKSLEKYLKKHNVEFVWLLTATPFLSTPWNIYRLGTLVGAKWSYFGWKVRFFNEIKMGPRRVPVPKKGCEKELRKKMLEIGDTCTLEECIDVPDQVFETEYFELTKEQAEAVKRVREELFITRWTKRHEIEQGVLIKEKAHETFPSAKTDRIVSLATENRKMAVFCRYNSQIEMLKEALKATGKEVLIINGKVKNRDEVVKRAEMLPECVVLINSACSEGYELPSIGVIVFASLDFSYKNFVQSQGRFLRINKPKKNYYLHLVANGVDKDVYNSIMAKQDFSFAIYGKEINDKMEECEKETSKLESKTGSKKTFDVPLPLSSN
jgi:superfamily II DNA or RNA helicase